MAVKNWKIALAVSVALAFGAACSTSSHDDTNNGDLPPAGNAGTDAAPAANPDQPAADASNPAPADGSATADAPPPADPQLSGQFEDYTVQAGDTLMKIAFEHYGDLYMWNKILDANKDKVTNPNKIPAGTVLKIEKPSTPVAVEKNGDNYLIKQGDTLGTIADDVYGTKRKWKRLYEQNRQLIRDPNKIYAGFHLYYTMTDEEKQEADKLKASKGMSGDTRVPASDSAATASPAPADTGAAAPPADQGAAPPADAGSPPPADQGAGAPPPADAGSPPPPSSGN